MSLVGLLAIVAIIIALYALAQPIQRKTLCIFVPVWLIPVSLLISSGILVWREAVSTFGCVFNPWTDFVTKIFAFMVPILGALIALFFWHRAKLTSTLDKRFRDFVLTSINDNHFHELVRILKRNEESLEHVVEPNTLNMLFDKKLVRAINRFPDWFHLVLLKPKIPYFYS